MLQDAIHLKYCMIHVETNQVGNSFLVSCYVSYVLLHTCNPQIPLGCPCSSIFHSTSISEHNHVDEPPGSMEVFRLSLAITGSLDVLMPRSIGLWRFQVAVGQDVFAKQEIKHGLENQGILRSCELTGGECFFFSFGWQEKWDSTQLSMSQWWIFHHWIRDAKRTIAVLRHTWICFFLVEARTEKRSNAFLQTRMG